MILLYALAAWYGLAFIVGAYELTAQSWRNHRTRTTARALARSKKRAHARALISLPQPVPEGDQAWVVTHADALLSLSPEMRAEFTTSTSTRGRKPRNQIYHPYTVGALQGSISINEVRSLKAPDSRKKVVGS